MDEVYIKNLIMSLFDKIRKLWLHFGIITEFDWTYQIGNAVRKIRLEKNTRGLGLLPSSSLALIRKLLGRIISDYY